MKFSFFLFFTFVIVASCVQEKSVEILPEKVEGASEPIGPEYPVANVKKVFTVKVIPLNYSTEAKEKLKKAESILEKIFNSEEYKKEVLSRKFTNTKGLTNQEIYDKLFSGAEALLPAVNYQMDLRVEMYYSMARTVGYTYPKDLVVHTNSKYHKTYSACEVASNICHEWIHKMGFGHSSAKDFNSVPYSHNSIIKKLCNTSK